MRIRNLLLLALITLALNAQGKMTLEQLKGFVKSSVDNHLTDKQIADYLHKVQLSNQLDDRTIEELQGMGAGPKTWRCCTIIRDSSASLPRRSHLRPSRCMFRRRRRTRWSRSKCWRTRRVRAQLFGTYAGFHLRTDDAAVLRSGRGRGLARERHHYRAAQLLRAQRKITQWCTSMGVR